MTDLELLDKAAHRLLSLIERIREGRTADDADEASSVFNEFESPTYAVLVNRATNEVTITINE